MEEFKGSLGNYKILTTDDGTLTLFSEFFNENCHNTGGAYAETIHNYINGCEIPDKINQNSELNILDVGFGVGMGLLALTKEQDKNKTINYYSIEIDPELALWTLKNILKIDHYVLDETNEMKRLLFQIENIKCTIFIGDARLTLPYAKLKKQINSIDAIFQDPFSPKKNSKLWTVEWFSFLKSISSNEVILSTYSSSISIRKSLISAGFGIESRVGFKNKRTMTRAFLNKETSIDLLRELQRSPILELRDN